MTVWIGEIQWMRRNGFDVGRNPILKPLETIEFRDAILNPDGSEAEWSKADVVIGNPPFLGGKLLRTVLGTIMSNACLQPTPDACRQKPIWWSIGSPRCGSKCPPSPPLGAERAGVRWGIPGRRPISPPHPPNPAGWAPPSPP